MTVYAPCTDITKTVTPDLKLYNSGLIYFLDLSGNTEKYPLGGTSLSTVYNQIGCECSDVYDVQLLKRAFNVIQNLIDQRLIISGHDRSDGGLIVTLLEMAFGGNCGIDIDTSILTSTESTSGHTDEHLAIKYFFNENLGLVIEILPQNQEYIERILENSNIPYTYLGRVTERCGNVKISFNNHCLINESMSKLRDIWESTSFALELLQCNNNCILQERELMLTRPGPTYRITTASPIISFKSLQFLTSKPRVAILRQEGTNGDREMSSAFYTAGFEVWDVNMNDLINQQITLNYFKGIVFCGGFSYADVNGSAKGWAATIRYHENLFQQFQSFKNRLDSWSLGVCNGCQLMALLGWIPFNQTTSTSTSTGATTSSATSNATSPLEINDQPRFLHNESKRFESRWCCVKIEKSKSILLKNLENNILGIWIQHGEGRLTLTNSTHLSLLQSSNLISLTYVDDEWNSTEKYPMNPNGSPLGIAGLCSEDGRHLAMMPHPERCFLKWQWPYQPYEWRNMINPYRQDDEIETTPWIQLFQNAYEFSKLDHESL